MENSIIDLIIRIKNGYMARKEKKKKSMTIDLAYEEDKPAISDVKIYSKPGMRLYISYKNLKPVLSGFGYSILSTSHGIMTDREAKKAKLGGELLFSFW